MCITAIEFSLLKYQDKKNPHIYAKNKFTGFLTAIFLDMQILFAYIVGFFFLWFV